MNDAEPAEHAWRAFNALLVYRTDDWSEVDFAAFDAEIAAGMVPEILKTTMCDSLVATGWPVEHAKYKVGGAKALLLEMFRKPPPAEVIRLDDYRSPP